MKRMLTGNRDEAHFRGVWHRAALGVVALMLACSSSSSNSPSASPCRSLSSGDGCYCGDDAAQSTDPLFPSSCSRQGLGGHSICCKGAKYCQCRKAQCGRDSATSCTCGVVDVELSSKSDSCTGTASMCCTDDTGYCYCEEGCDKRFGSRSIGTTCDLATAPLRCSADFGETEVDACE